MAEGGRQGHLPLVSGSCRIPHEDIPFSPELPLIPLKRVDHISMAHPDWKAQAELLERVLGFKFLHSWEAHEGSDFAGSVSQVRGTGIEWEIIAPAGPGSFVQRFLDEQGPGLHHVTVEVRDLDEACAVLERQGIKPLGGIQDDGQWKLTYIHPKDSGGILWQLFVPYRFPAEADRNAGGGWWACSGWTTFRWP
jgi:methylmalonyl-CoA/ethylmalonyl-CoA epimerase